MDSKTSRTTQTPRKSDAGADRVLGTVLRVTYHNKENDYRVVKLAPLMEIERARLNQRW